MKGKVGGGPSPVLRGTKELHPRVGAATVRSWGQVHGLGEACQQQLQQLHPWGGGLMEELQYLRTPNWGGGVQAHPAQPQLKFMKRNDLILSL